MAKKNNSSFVSIMYDNFTPANVRSGNIKT